MARHSRREFVGGTAAGLAGLLMPRWLRETRRLTASPEPDRGVFNAKVYTMDATTPIAAALARKAGRFGAVGSTADITAPVGKRTETLDVEQMTIVPRCRDSH